MKMMKKIPAIFILLFLVVSCAATTPMSLPEKYDLDHRLQSVKRLSVVRAPNWMQADNQSLIFTVNGSNFYLAVLDRPLESDISNKTIRTIGRSSGIIAGHHRLHIRDASDGHFYVIEKIYKLKDKNQVKKIKDLLAKK